MKWRQKFFLFYILLTTLVVGLFAGNIKIGPKQWSKYNNIAKIRIKNDYFSARMVGVDPWIAFEFPKIAASEIKFIKFELQIPKSIGVAKGQIFWKTVKSIHYSGKHLSFKLISDGNWHEYIIPIHRYGKWKGEITGIRFDPVYSPEALDIFKLRNFELVKAKNVRKEEKHAYSAKIKLKTKNSNPLSGMYPRKLFNSAGALLIDGKPEFIIHTGDLPVVDNPFAELADAGFNLITFAGISKGIIDVLEDCGIKVMLAVRYEKQQTAESFGKRVLELYKKYPKLGKVVAAYYAVDEPVFNKYPLKPLLAAYDFYKNEIPRKPVFINHAPRNTVELLKKYNHAGDITGVDIYPVPDGGHSEMTNKTISCVGDYTDKMIKSALPGQPVWIYLQAYERGVAKEKRTPTYDESRFMAYNAIMHGAMGICYYGLRHLRWPNKMWPRLKRLVPEIRGLNDILTEPWNSELLKRDGFEVRYKSINGKLYIFCSNNTNRSRQLELSLDQGMSELFVLFEKRKIQLRGTGFTDKFKPYGIHIYSNNLIKKSGSAPKSNSNFKWVSQSEGHWIWDKEAQRKDDVTVYFRRVFDVGVIPEKAEIIITVDNNYRLYCNGKLVGEDIKSSQGGFRTAEKYNIKSFLNENSKNIIAVEGINDTSIAGLWAEITIGDKIIYSDTAWRTSLKKQPNWFGDIQDKNWHKATSYGKPPCKPWNSFLRQIK